MPTYDFYLICAGPEASKDARRQFLTGILCDDSQTGSVLGITRLDFQREAPNYQLAVRSVLDDLKRDAPELEVLRYTLARAHHAEVERSIEEAFPGATALRQAISRRILGFPQAGADRRSPEGAISCP
jgi:hypothetical protein